MSAFPDTNTRDAEVRAARRVPREPWWHDHIWVRFSLHCCHMYRHHLADSTSLQLVYRQSWLRKAKRPQRAQAPCAVEYDSWLVAAVRSVQDDDSVAPTAPRHGADGLAARKPESVIGPSRMREEHVHVLVQANQARCECTDERDLASGGSHVERRHQASP